jgi:hypothetical protein
VASSFAESCCDYESHGFSHYISCRLAWQLGERWSPAPVRDGLRRRRRNPGHMPRRQWPGGVGSRRMPGWWEAAVGGGNSSVTLSPPQLPFPSVLEPRKEESSGSWASCGSLNWVGGGVRSRYWCHVGGALLRGARPWCAAVRGHDWGCFGRAGSTY